MAAKITVSIGIRWSEGGDSIAASTSSTVDQVGNAAIGNVQSIADTTVAIDLGEVAGEKYLSFKNFADPKTEAANIIYVDQVTPVVPSSDTAIKIVPGAPGTLLTTKQDTWYAIGAVAGPTDLGVFAFEV